MKQITITSPDDWHLHFRDGAMLFETVGATARCFRRAIVMPNLSTPVTTTQQALDYKQRIIAALPQKTDFEPLMTLYLTDNTSTEEIQKASSHGIVAAKLYPSGATTHSDNGVTDIKKLRSIFEAMQACGMLLLIHGEVTDANIDIFDREKVFIEKYLTWLTHHFPALKIVLEHITTKDAVDFVMDASDRVGATITPQHLMLNRNDLLVGGIRPHNYCLPVLKRRTHQEALREAVSSTNKKFFLGTDSAPHSKDKKENACGCAGCYSAWSAIELYTQVFEELDALDKLEAFASHNGPDFYGLPRNTTTLTLVKQSWTLPDTILLDNQETIVPFQAGNTIAWQVLNQPSSI